MSAKEIKSFHKVILVLKDKKPARNHCGHVYMPHDIGMCDLNNQVCLEESYPGVCNIRSEEEADSVKEGMCPYCNEQLESFSGQENLPAYLYCPKCNDRAYGQDGQVLAKIEQGESKCYQ
jgi:hypothetical protein